MKNAISAILSSALFCITAFSPTQAHADGEQIFIDSKSGVTLFLEKASSVLNADQRIIGLKNTNGYPVKVVIDRKEPGCTGFVGKTVIVVAGNKTKKPADGISHTANLKVELVSVSAQ